ncbi:hypothetical protein TRFO_08160 [Tritrichomonas foetus]|uniref:Uncharacterized protein n=1 Tax=Tritrichomonas foetus TaxID=1144522 RepID=A0A1J4JME3_9EUKA|nr:hypothetical protein TRFO_08160 [Tritrichomonas foetus]|eukprot:OHS99865.1 hypothetical protein TRFO_08160 [Tritrichomonas foetus]
MLILIPLFTTIAASSYIDKNCENSLLTTEVHFCLHDSKEICEKLFSGDIYSWSCFEKHYKTKNATNVHFHADPVNYTSEKEKSLNLSVFGSLSTLNLPSEKVKISINYDITASDNSTFTIVFNEATVTPTGSRAELILSGLKEYSFAPGKKNGPLLIVNELSDDLSNCDLTSFSEIQVPQQLMKKFNPSSSSKRTVVKVSEQSCDLTFEETKYLVIITENEIEITSDDSIMVLDGKYLSANYNFILQNPNNTRMMPSLTFECKTGNKPSKLANPGPGLGDNLYLFTVNVQSQWNIRFKEGEWLPYLYTCLKGQNIEALTVILDASNPGISIELEDSEELSVFLNTLETTISKINGVKYVHINNLIHSNETNSTIYIGYSSNAKYYVDRRNQYINVIFGISIQDEFFTPYGIYKVQHIAKLTEEQIRKNKTSHSYKSNIFLDFQPNHFNNKTNKLRIMNDTLIDLTGLSKPVFVNENVTFEGNVHYLNIYKDTTSKLPKEENGNDEIENQYFVLCQPDLDCDKFQLAPWDDIPYTKPSVYYQDINYYKKVCKSRTEIYPLKDIVDESDSKCCKTTYKINDVTKRLKCLGFEYQNPKLLSLNVEKDSEVDNVEIYYQNWLKNTLHDQTQSIVYYSSHPLGFLRYNNISNVSVTIASEKPVSILVEKDTIEKFQSVTVRANSYMTLKFRNQSNKIIPFKKLTLPKNMITFYPDLAVLDWSHVEYLDVNYDFYVKNENVLKKIHEIEINIDNFKTRLNDFIEKEFPNDFNDSETEIQAGFKATSEGEYRGTIEREISFADDGITVTIDGESKRFLSLYPTQSIKHIIASGSGQLYKYKYHVKFGNVAVDYSIPLANIENRIITESLSQKTTLLISRGTIIIVSSRSDSLDCIISGTPILSITCDDSIQEETLTGEFTLGGLTSTNGDIRFDFKSPKLNFSSFSIEKYNGYNFYKPKVFNYNNQLIKSITIANFNWRILAAAGDFTTVDLKIKNLINISIENNKINTITIENYDGYNPDIIVNAPFGKNSDQKLKFSSQSAKVKNIQVVFRNSSANCPSTETQYKITHPGYAINQTLYSKYEGFQMLACEKEAMWSSFTQSSYFFHCQNMTMKTEMKEFTDVTYAEKKLFGFSVTENIESDIFVCLGHRNIVSEDETK